MNIDHIYRASDDRYTQMQYRHCGQSGLKLPLLSLGLWHNFGHTQNLETQKSILFHAFDKGITHFDLANNYGPPYGSAEENFGSIYSKHLKPYRDEMLLSTKAGYDMWPGPYGEWGSRKYLLSSLDQSLKRMKVDYVDIFYSHRFDPNTPLEETMSALETAYKSGKALYVGVSSYSATKTREAENILKQRGIHCLIHQPSYSLLNRWVEADLLDTLKDLGIGCIVFSPIAQGLLSEKYLNGIPENSRFKKSDSILDSHLDESVLNRIRKLNDIAKKRGQSLTQMAIAWVLRNPAVTSALIGVSSLKQLKENIASLENIHFSKEELKAIDQYAEESGINLWATSSQHK